MVMVQMTMTGSESASFQRGIYQCRENSSGTFIIRLKHPLPPGSIRSASGRQRDQQCQSCDGKVIGPNAILSSFPGISAFFRRPKFRTSYGDRQSHVLPCRESLLQHDIGVNAMHYAQIRRIHHSYVGTLRREKLDAWEVR